jgi:hypothetical protein
MLHHTSFLFVVYLVDGVVVVGLGEIKGFVTCHASGHKRKSETRPWLALDDPLTSMMARSRGCGSTGLIICMDGHEDGEDV